MRGYSGQASDLSWTVTCPPHFSKNRIRSPDSGTVHTCPRIILDLWPPTAPRPVQPSTYLPGILCELWTYTRLRFLRVWMHTATVKDPSSEDRGQRCPLSYKGTYMPLVITYCIQYKGIRNIKIYSQYKVLNQCWLFNLSLNRIRADRRKI